MEKVVCALCRLENNRRCIKKNAKVKINKQRVCKFYDEDEYKLNAMKAKQDVARPMATKRPDYYWDAARMKEEKRKAKEAATPRQSMISSDPKHPLTGDLSRFKSTATKDDKED